MFETNGGLPGLAAKGCIGVEGVAKWLKSNGPIPGLWLFGRLCEPGLVVSIEFMSLERARTNILILNLFSRLYMERKGQLSSAFPLVVRTFKAT